MKLRLLLALCLALAFSSVRAADTPPSQESIREMLAVTEARKLIDNMHAQVAGIMKNSMQQAMKGQKAPPGVQKIMDRFSEKAADVMKEELGWEKLEPMYFEIYQKSLTQEEVDGMLIFYKSKAGQAVIKKLPVLMQQIMASMQTRMGPMMAKVQVLTKENDRGSPGRAGQGTALTETESLPAAMGGLER